VGAPEALAQTALANRADLQSLSLAVAEADARVRLEVANRFGNPSLGPAYEYNETRVNFVGGVFSWALPVFNMRQGEILQRKAERERVLADRSRLEVQVRQDVAAALARLAEAQRWVDAYRTEALPALRQTVAGLDRLFAQGEPGLDLGRLVAARQRLLRARDVYLDALWELSQARADLAAAVGDPSLALPPPTACATAAPPSQATQARPPGRMLPPAGEHRAALLPPRSTPNPEAPHAGRGP
jgi:outer membrane protein TolC